jgi:catechol 2,3-dioxygenase-like lactoylglutathione lyase family enzyme
MTDTVHQVLLIVSDLEDSVHFYNDVLGLGADRIGEGSAEFQVNNQRLVLEEDFDEDIFDEFNLDPPGDVRGSGVIIGLDVSNVTQRYEQITDSSSGGVLPPREVEWGRRICFIEDPDGYTIELSEPL